MMVLIFIDLAMRISLDQRKRALEIYMRSDLSFTLFITNWQSLFGNEPYPNRKFMSRLVKKFRETGSVGDRKRNRTCTVRSESNVVSVGAYFQNNKGTSLRGFIKETHIDISISSPEFIPELRAIFPEDIFNELLFQLDGARGHTAAKVKSCLNAIFPDRWIGNGGPMHWAPRSPDLTPLGMLLSRLISLHLLFFLRFFLLGLP